MVVYINFPNTMMNAVRNCRDTNIHGNCTWIMGYPGEELKHLKTSVAFIKWQQDFWTNGLVAGSEEYQNAYDSVNRNMFTATAYPGTEMWKTERNKLTEYYDISIDKYARPVCDDKFHTYVLELDDATKVLNDKNGNPVNFGAMPMDQFLQAREYVDSDQLEKNIGDVKMFDNIGKIIVPARKGSKGMPKKNRFLLTSTLDVIPKELLHKTVVTTDDEEIKSATKKYSNEIHIHNRSNKSSSDIAPMTWCVDEVLNECDVDRTKDIILLYLTYPERTWEDITKIYEFL